MALPLTITIRGAFVGLTTHQERQSTAELDSLTNPALLMPHPHANPASLSSTSSWKKKWWAAYQSFQRFAKAHFSTGFFYKSWSIQPDKALNVILKAILCAQAYCIGFSALPAAWKSIQHEKLIYKQGIDKQELTSQLDSMHVVFFKEQAALIRLSCSGACCAPASASPTNSDL